MSEPLEGGANPQPLLDSRFTRGDLQFSGDGKWVAYESNESGRNEIYVTPDPGPGGKSQVSAGGGTRPRWNRNGRELFFRSGDGMMAVDVDRGAAFRAGPSPIARLLDRFLRLPIDVVRAQLDERERLRGCLMGSYVRCECETLRRVGRSRKTVKITVNASR